MAEGSRFASLEDDDILKIIDDKDAKATKNVIINTKKTELNKKCFKCRHMKMY
jgi:hypothetical protein